MSRDKIYLDMETADRITIDSLKDAVAYLQKELEDHKNGAWLHPDDVVMNHKYIEAMKFVLAYYGE